MKSALLASAFLAVFPSALAAPQGPGNRPGLCYPSACGYWLVNNAGTVSPNHHTCGAQC